MSAYVVIAQRGTRARSAAPASAQSIGPLAPGLTPVCRAMISAAASPQLRPWHGPMPHRVADLSWFSVRAPRAATRSMSARVTSSQRQTIVSAVAPATRPGRSAIIRLIACPNRSARANRARVRRLATRKAAGLSAPKSRAAASPASSPAHSAAATPEMPAQSPAI